VPLLLGLLNVRPGLTLFIAPVFFSVQRIQDWLPVG